MDDYEEYYHTVMREEEYNEDKQKDNMMFLDIIARRVKDKRRRVQLILTYFGESNGRTDENFGDC